MSQTPVTPPPARPPLSWAACYVLGAVTFGVYPIAVEAYCQRRGRPGLLFHANQAWATTFLAMLVVCAINLTPLPRLLRLYLRHMDGPRLHHTTLEAPIVLYAFVILITLALNLWPAIRLMRGRFFLIPFLGKPFMMRQTGFPNKGSPQAGDAELAALLDLKGVPPAFRAIFLVGRGFYMRWGGHPDKAVEQFTAAMSLSGLTKRWQAWAFYGRCFAWRDLGDADKVIEDSTAAIDLAALKPADTWDLLMARGGAWQRKRQYSQAVEDYTRALEYPWASTRWRAEALLRRGFARWRQGKSDEAKADLHRVLGDRHASAMSRSLALLLLGRVQYEEGDLGGATARYAAALDLPELPEPNRAWLLAAKGYCEFRMGNLAALEEGARAGIAMNDMVAGPHLALGLALLLAAKSDEARAEFVRGAELCTLAEEVQGDGIDLVEDALRGRDPVAGADAILALLRARKTALEANAEGSGA
jgi:tetratricopeptide (TPR) repeat protein